MPATGLMLAGARPIAARLGVLPSQVSYWSRAGLLPTFKVGRTICADPQALDAWLADRQAKASPTPTDRHEAA